MIKLLVLLIGIVGLIAVMISVANIFILLGNKKKKIMKNQSTVKNGLTSFIILSVIIGAIAFLIANSLI